MNPDALPIYRCTTCQEWTREPSEHLADVHDSTVLRYDDFVLVRAATHRAGTPREPELTQNQALF